MASIKALLMILLAISTSGGLLLAREINVQTPERLQSLLREYTYCLVLFYQKNQEAMRMNFSHVSNVQRYKESRVKFFTVDASDSSMQYAMRMYQVAQLPTVILFKNGKNIGSLKGLFTEQTLNKFIHDIIGGELAQIQKTKEEIRRLKQQRYADSSVYWGYPYATYPYYYPYNYPYYGPYYGRPGVGFGFQFGF
jgi:thioredoxin-related protein